VCFCVNSCWSLCVRRRCFSSSFLSTTTTTPSSPSSPSLVHALSLPRFPFLVPPPLPHFGKFALVRLRQVLFVHQRESIQAKKRQGANILKKTRKAKKRRKGKSAPYKATELYLGAGLFPCWAPPPFPVLGFGAIFFLISDCQVMERRIPAVVSHPDLGAGLPLWTGTHQGASPLGRPHLCCLCTFTLVSSNIATCLALLFNLALLFDCANPCN